MSLSITVLFIPLYSYVKDSILPIGTLLTKGKPPASGKFGTLFDGSILDKVDALEPFHGILSGSSDRVSEAIGSIQWRCLDVGRSRKLWQSNQTEPKSGKS